ncbi:MAG TPA: hypothetical protein VF263_24125 [Longimicrobiaceae bacterium]
MRKIGRIGRGLFGIAVLSALGVGVTQAFAEPPAAARRECRPIRCTWECSGKGSDVHGECIDGTCVCVRTP